MGYDGVAVRKGMLQRGMVVRVGGDDNVNVEVEAEAIAVVEQEREE